MIIYGEDSQLIMYEMITLTMILKIETLTIILSQAKYNCLISVFAADGSVSVAHNGIEMGQGINTKVAQVVAFELGIPLSLVQVQL